jgi:hypothetical protein
MTINFLLHYTTLLILPNRPYPPQQGDLEESLKDTSQSIKKIIFKTHFAHGKTPTRHMASR